MFNYPVISTLFDVIHSFFRGLEYSLYGITVVLFTHAITFVLWKLFWNWLNRFECLKSAEVKRLERIIRLLEEDSLSSNRRGFEHYG